MRPDFRTVAGFAASVFLVSGCAWWQQQSRTTKGAAYGTGVGAAAGAAVGAALGGGEGAWKGAAVGAAVGGLGGTAIGYYMDKQAKEMQEILARQDRLEREGEALRVSLASDVLFESGSARLQPGAEDKLRELSRVLQRYPRTSVEIVGHTDNRGTEAFNQPLSERRAAAVAEVLRREGVGGYRLTTRGLGETRPVADNGTMTGRAMNRRVELLLHPTDEFVAENRGSGPGTTRAEPAGEPY
jgi:outer membrane protein OmpA-like peptidoglycan-associated protein